MVAIDWEQVIFKGLNMRGIYGREMFETWYKMSALLQAGLDITHVRGAGRYTTNPGPIGFGKTAWPPQGRLVRLAALQSQAIAESPAVRRRARRLE